MTGSNINVGANRTAPAAPEYTTDMPNRSASTGITHVSTSQAVAPLALQGLRNLARKKSRADLDKLSTANASASPASLDPVSRGFENGAVSGERLTTPPIAQSLRDEVATPPKNPLLDPLFSPTQHVNLWRNSRPEIPMFMIFAGPNGSGKSTIKEAIAGNPEQFSGEYINADEIARSLRKQIPDDYARIQKASQIADTRCIGALRERRDFAFETVMSTPEKVALMTRAKAAGYHVSLFFVTTEDPELNVCRSTNRIAAGGHAVRPDVIRRRYDATMKLLPVAFEHADQAVVLDNSKSVARIVATKAGEEVVFPVSDVVSPWVAEKLKAPYVSRLASRQLLSSSFNDGRSVKAAKASHGQSYPGQVLRVTEHHVLQEVEGERLLHDRQLAATPIYAAGQKQKQIVSYQYTRGKIVPVETSDQALHPAETFSQATIDGKPYEVGRHTPAIIHRYLKETLSNNCYRSVEHLRKSAETHFRYIDAEKSMLRKTDDHLYDPESKIFAQAAWMGHLERGLWHAQQDFGKLDRSVLGDEAMGDAKPAKESPFHGERTSKRAIQLSYSVRSAFAMMLKGEQGPFTKEQVRAGFECAQTGQLLAGRLKIAERGAYRRLHRVDADRSGTELTRTTTGMDLSADNCASLLDQSGLTVMTGLSGSTSAAVVATKFGADRARVSWSAPGVNKTDAKQAIIDLAFHYNRAERSTLPAFIQKEINALRISNGLPTKKVSTSDVFTHSYPEIHLTVALTLDGTKPDDTAAVTEAIEQTRTVLDSIQASADA